MQLSQLRPLGDNCVLPHPMSPAAPSTVGPGRGLQLPARPPAVGLQLLACPSAAGLQLPACSVVAGQRLPGVAGAASPQPWPSGSRRARAAARPATRRRGPCPGGRSRFPAVSPPSRAVSPPRRRYGPLTRRSLLWQGLGGRPAERRGRAQGTGESCAGLPRELGPARLTGECFSLRVKVLIPRVSAETVVCPVSRWEFLLEGAL